jgi:hypothetical protein
MGIDAFETAKSAVTHPQDKFEKAKSSLIKDSKSHHHQLSAQAFSSEGGGNKDLHVPHEDA